MTTIGGLLGLAVQTPVGAAIHATHRKRSLIVVALAVLGIGSVVIYTFPTIWPVMVANTLIAVVGDVFGPAVAALTLGLFARAALARRMGRNAAFDHAGTSRLPPRPALSAGPSHSGRCSFSCPSSRCCPLWPCCRSQAPPSTMSERAARTLKTARLCWQSRVHSGVCSWAVGRC